MRATTQARATPTTSTVVADPARRRLVIRFGLPIALILAVAGGVFAALHGRETGVVTGLEVAVAILLAAAMAFFAVSLPGIAAEGLVVALLSIAAAAMAWSHTSKPAYTFAVLAVQVVVFTVWTFPWFRHVPVLPRLGSAWLGIAVWLLGAVSALVLAPVVGVQRVIYAGIAVLTVLVFLRARERGVPDVTVGVVAGIILGLAFIVVSGAANIFSLTHYAPPGPWGYRFNGRFWGGPIAVLHPNGMALAALIVSLRIAPDTRFPRWQRLAALALTTLFLYETSSRTGVLAAFVAACAWAIVILWRHRSALRRPLRYIGSREGATTVLVAILPIVLSVGVLFAAGGRGFLLSQRYGADTKDSSQDEATKQDDLNAQGVTSGRTANWGAMFKDWQHDSVLEKAFGNSDNARGYLLRHAKSVKRQPKLTADNAIVSELRRGGVLGVVTFFVGFGLLFVRAFRRGSPLWWRLSLIGAFSTVLTSDQTLGGTGTTLWLLLIAGEVTVFGGLLASGWSRKKT